MRRRTFIGRSSQALVGFGVLRGAAACRRTAGPHPEFAAFRASYMKKMLELSPVTSTYLGGDGYDASLGEINGRLRDYSSAGVQSEIAWLRETQGRLAGFDHHRLDAAEQIDHEVMQAQTAYLLHQLGERRYHERCIDSYVAEPFRGVDWQIQQMADAGNGLLGTEEEWRLVVARLRAVGPYLEAARANLTAGASAGNLPDRRMVQRDGIAGSQANVTYFRTTLPGQARGYLGSRPFAAAVLADIREAGAAASDGYARFADFMRQTYRLNETEDRFAVGEDEYLWRVANCLRDGRTAQQLFDYGAEQVALYQDQIFRVAGELARELNLTASFDTAEARRAAVSAVLERLSQDSPRNDDELFRWYRETGERAVAYGREHQLFDIPADYRLDVVPTPPVLRSTTDAAYYPAPPFKRSGVGRFYLTPTDNNPAALRLNNRASIADTAIHEGFPGHDWHYKYMTAHASGISPVRWLTPGAVEDSFSMWEDSMAAEGWALYAEELMAEPAEGKPHGFYSPAEHLYELQGQLLRAVRVRVDVGIHTRRMTFDEAVDYFTANVEFYPGARAAAGRDPRAAAITAGATRAMYRYSIWPTQAITYNLGKNAIIGLREELRRRQGGEFSAQRFHERFMGMGTIPAGYFRETMLEM